MIVKTEYADISVAGSPMRTFVAAPNAEGTYPGIWCYSDIFQLTPPLLRTCVRLAGYGFVAAAPEIYRRIEPLGTVIAFDDAGGPFRCGLPSRSGLALETCEGGGRKDRRTGFLHRRPPSLPRGVPAGC